MKKVIDSGPGEKQRHLAAFNPVKNKDLSEIQAALDRHCQWITGDPRFLRCNAKIEKTKEGLAVKGRVMSPQMRQSILEVLDCLKIKADVEGLEIYPDRSTQGLHYGLVRVGVADVYAEADEASERVTSGLYGECVFILSKENGFLFVRTLEGYLGWTQSGNIRPIDLQTLRTWKKGPHARLLCDYDLPDFTLPIGAVLPLVGDDTIQCVDGAEVKPDRESIVLCDRKTPAFDEAVHRETERYLDTCYKWGGRSKEGIDCSGLVQMVYRALGIMLPRDAGQQVLCGEICATPDWYSDLQTGDLLFFCSTLGRIGHVALSYGGSTYIHASSDKGMTISSLDETDPHYDAELKARFFLAKRVML